MIKYFFVFLLLSFEIFSQTKTAFTNYFQFGTGTENVGEAGLVGTREKKYFDNYLDGKIYFPKVTIGFRLEESNPPEFGLKFQGIRKKFVQYQDENFNFRVGDLYGLYGHGLSLNLFETRSIAYNTGIEGLSAKFENENITAQIIGGEMDFLVPSTLYETKQRFENYFIEGASVNYKFDKLNFGSSFIFAKAKFPNQFVDGKYDSFKVQLPEMFLRFQQDAFELSLSYNLKKTILENNLGETGSGFYASISYAKSGFGINFDWKDYRYDFSNPIEKTNIFRQTRMLPFQNPPIVHKEHTFSLLKRYPYVADFNDEVGFQIEAFYLFDDVTTLNFNTSVSSDHFEYSYNPNNSEFKRIENGSIYFPSLNNNRSPFWELYFEVEHYYDFEIGSYFKTAINRRSETVFDPISFFAQVQPTRTVTIPMEVQHMLNEILSLKISSENQWVTKYPSTKTYYNHLLSLQFSRSPDFSIAARWETTTSNNEPNNQKNWGVIEIGYKVGNKHNIAISYGSERGGQVCSNGICRTVNPFNGLRFSFTSSL